VCVGVCGVVCGWCVGVVVGVGGVLLFFVVVWVIGCYTISVFVLIAPFLPTGVWSGGGSGGGNTYMRHCAHVW